MIHQWTSAPKSTKIHRETLGSAGDLITEPRSTRNKSASSEAFDARRPKSARSASTSKASKSDDHWANCTRSFEPAVNMKEPTLNEGVFIIFIIFIFKTACLWHICRFPKILNVWVLPFFTTDGFLAHCHFFRTHFQPPCSVLGMKSTNTTIAESTPLHSIPHMARRFTALAVTEPVSGGVSTSSKARASSMAKRVAWAP